MHWRVMLLGIICIWAVAVEAAEWTKEEQEAWLAAQEDYNFGDLDSAIRGIKALLKQHENDPRLWRLLAMSYAEAGRTKEAKKAFARWRALVEERALQDRDAVLMEARVTMQTEDHRQAVKVLRQWLARHADDREAELQLGAALVGAKMLDEAKRLWMRVLAQADNPPSTQAAAHYYLAWIAAARGNTEKAEQQAELALKVDPEGPYAASAKALLQGLRQAQGFSAQIALGAHHTSNVELLPDIRRPQPGKSKTDNYLTAHLGLGWRAQRWALSYQMDAQKYAKRSDYDLLLQILALEIALPKGWAWTPRVEHAMLAREFLFSGVGFDLSWSRGSWQAGYALRARRYSKSYGKDRVDLSRLGGLGHELSIGYGASDAQRQWSITGYWHLEQTKGDALHLKTDDYQQLGLMASWSQRFAEMDLTLQASGWWRAYRKADPLANGLKRRDQYLQLGAEWGWRLGKQGRHRIALAGHWQRNGSNYKAPSVPAVLDKTYSEWALGVQWQAAW